MRSSAFSLATALTAAQLLLVLAGMQLPEASFVVAFGAVLAPLYSARAHRFYRQAFSLGRA